MESRRHGLARLVERESGAQQLIVEREQFLQVFAEVRVEKLGDALALLQLPQLLLRRDGHGAAHDWNLRASLGADVGR